MDNRNFTQIDSVEAFEGEDGQFTVPVEGGRYRIETSTFEQSYVIAAQVRGGDDECAENPGASNGAGDPDPPGENPDPQPLPVEPGPGNEEIVNIPPKDLPRTGGLPFTLPVAVLLIAGGLVGVGIVRRR